MKTLIFLPAFNEEATIGDVLRRLPKTIPDLGRIDRLVVDDGSTDRTATLAREAGAWVVSHSRNLGVGRAFQTAVAEALHRRVDLLVSIDADGQFDAGQIPDLIAPILRGEADFVTGSRFDNASRPPGMPRVKFWGNIGISRFIRFITGVRLADVSCGFRAYSREALLQLNLFGRFTYTQETILDLAFKDSRIAEVPIRVTYFPDRRSRVSRSIPRYALNALKIITRTVRDFRPLRFFGTIGVVVFTVGLAADLFLLRHYLLTGSYSPYKAVGFAGGTLNIAGILLIGLGVLADMLDRMRVNQERILYYHKRHAFDDPASGSRRLDDESTPVLRD